MDVGLGPPRSSPTSGRRCLNPCFSGCWSRTQLWKPIAAELGVLILVLVDVGLGHTIAAGMCSLSEVLILVLVDVGLGRAMPALVGRISSAVLILVLVDVGLGHRNKFVHRSVLPRVLILVLVDVGLGLCIQRTYGCMFR